MDTVYIRSRQLQLEREIYLLLVEFESYTETHVKNVDLTRVIEFGGANSLFSVKLEVEL